MKRNKVGSPMRLRGRHEVSVKRFCGHQNKDLEKVGKENWWRRMNSVREGFRDLVWIDLSQDES